MAFAAKKNFNGLLWQEKKSIFDFLDKKKTFMAQCSGQESLGIYPFRQHISLMELSKK